ncbi:MAG: MFS transporter [Bacteroidales bacterium]|nr:MFS transporter [Bacteroidales bacterium]
MLPFQKNLSKPFYALLSLPATAMGFGLAVQIAVLSWLLSTKYGLDTRDIGLVWAMGPLGGLIGQIVIGIISDKVWVWNGRRRAFIWIGGVLAAMGLLSLPNIGIIQSALGIDGILGVAVVVSLTIDLAINVSFNPTRSIIADVTPEGRPRTKGYTWMQTISGSFGVLAYLIGAVWGNYVLIYFGVILILLFSIIPPFFIKEPRYLGHYGKDDDDAAEAGKAARALEGKKEATLVEIAKTIMPLWGFLLYALYGIFGRVGLIPVIPNYGFELFCLVLTIVVMIYTMSRKERGISKEKDGMIGFRKILAAHSFTWIGMQTIFIYLFAFVRFRIPELADVQIDPALLGEDTLVDPARTAAIDNTVGRIVNWSLFSLNLVAAIIPVFILEPMAARFGRVKTHAFSIAIMSFGALNILFFGYSPVIIYLLMAVVGIGWAATISLPFAIMSQKIPQDRMGFYMGLFNLSVTLPMFVSSFGMAEIVDAVDNKGIIFILLAVTAALSAILWAFVKEPKDVFTEHPVLAAESAD